MLQAGKHAMDSSCLSDPFGTDASTVTTVKAPNSCEPSGMKLQVVLLGGMLDESMLGRKHRGCQIQCYSILGKVHHPFQSLFYWGLGCSLRGREFDPWPY